MVYYHAMVKLKSKNFPGCHASWGEHSLALEHPSVHE